MTFRLSTQSYRSTTLYERTAAVGSLSYNKRKCILAARRVERAPPHELPGSLTEGDFQLPLNPEAEPKYF